ncbi:hypothetical protein N6H14_09970 [Paenibacillus sp. CC-CFT747]|nr:hypothetical protein N6H14_09970 [Paenibacillus sp. CC-CFT747]
MIGLHLIFVAAWVGSSFVLLMLSLLSLYSGSQTVQIAIPSIMHAIDLLVIIPGTIGIIVTGVVLSLLTHWGIKKYHWVIVKEISTLFLAALGGVWLAPLVLRAVELSSNQGVSALTDPEYLLIHKKILLTSGIIIPLLLGMIFISKLKPWGKVKSKEKQAAAKA